MTKPTKWHVPPEAYLSYKLTKWAFGSGELIRTFILQGLLTDKQTTSWHCVMLTAFSIILSWWKSDNRMIAAMELMDGNFIIKAAEPNDTVQQRWFFYVKCFPISTNYKNALHHEKTCLCHMWTTKAQISRCICTVWSAPLLFIA